MRTRMMTAVGAAIGLTAIVALAGPAPEQKCQAAKNAAAGKYAACRQSAEKGLASTSDATKYAASIAKCEESFAEAWQKAIDSAAKAGAVCPDAPRVAGDYKSEIDAHSAKIATALGGGDLPTASTCGNGSVEAGEDCDFGTLAGATCSTATAGAAPYGTLDCGADCVFDTGACMPCPGKVLAGSCWLAGQTGQSCRSVCESASLAYDHAGTASGNCLEVGRLYSGNYEADGAPWGPLRVQSIEVNGLGCCDLGGIGPEVFYQDIAPMTGDTSNPQFSRFCSCR